MNTFVRLVSMCLGLAVALAAPAAVAADGFTLREVKTITPPGYYNGWPTVAARANGHLMVVWSGGRDGHVCPFGRVESMVSRDEGETWSWPRVVSDSALDDRDAGLVETRHGTLLLTTFVSEAYDAPKQRKSLDPQRAAKWRRFEHAGTPRELSSELGPRILRSLDGGVTWSAPVAIPVNSPHGPFQLGDGRLLYAGVSDVGRGRYAPNKERIVGVWESADDGATWRLLARLPARPGDNSRDYHELHGVEAADGHVIVHIRSHAGKKGDPATLQTLQTESIDGGRTWTEPRPIGVAGYPSHLVRLRDQRILMSYTYRQKPYEVHARVSSDQGRTWSSPMILTSNEHSWDLGYPSTVELKDGSLLTVWYEKTAASPHAVLRQARWALDPAR